MADVVLSFAGWRSPNNAVHRAIRELRPGDELKFVHEDRQWKLLDAKRRQVGRMAQKWVVPAGLDVVSAAVHGLFARWAKDGKDDEYARRLRSDSWEVVVPRLVLAPTKRRVDWPMNGSCLRSPGICSFANLNLDSVTATQGIYLIWHGAGRDPKGSEVGARAVRVGQADTGTKRGSAGGTTERMRKSCGTAGLGSL